MPEHEKTDITRFVVFAAIPSRDFQGISLISMDQAAWEYVGICGTFLSLCNFRLRSICPSCPAQLNALRVGLQVRFLALPWRSNHMRAAHAITS